MQCMKDNKKGNEGLDLLCVLPYITKKYINNNNNSNKLTCRYIEFSANTEYHTLSSDTCESAQSDAI